MEMEFEHLAVIDWDLGTKLAGNKKDLANDILFLLIKDLPNELNEIKKSNSDKNYQSLLSRVHKLHGALCYCGAPRLKAIVAALESDLKNNIMDNLPHLLHQLDTEVQNLLEHFPRQP